jgi:glycogen debranching enzyme
VTQLGPNTSFAPLQPGHIQVLGAHVEKGGVNFALIAPNAAAVDLCLFDRTGTLETQRFSVPNQTHGIWHGFLPNAQTGLLYGWRVHGPWRPELGQRFNHNKLLLDPCAKEVFGVYDGDDIHLGYLVSDPSQPDLRDNGASALKARVLADLPAASLLTPRAFPSQRIIYELHTKGFTALNSAIPEELRGTYAGLAHSSSIDYLVTLGVTSLSLMPVAHRLDEKRLLTLGLSNYWGYNPIAWSAPEVRYASRTAQPDGQIYGNTRLEFRKAIDALHAAGIEVLLDVVYNHSAETDELGPTLSLRGIDNATYYHLDPQNLSKYINWTGCGNCLNVANPLVLRMVMDSLRQWVTEFGVDGFRFDLAPVMARTGMHQAGEFNPLAPLLMAISQDPVLRQCTMIAEPWDIGLGGYRLGHFPSHWLEWNDRFRDTQRAFWLKHEASRGELATRLSGSTDFFDSRTRAPHSSVNFVTAHDGFTLTDLVSYCERRNWENGEENRDGHGHNLSVNFGVEGKTCDASISESRMRIKRLLLANTVLSLGTPMLLGGDEMGHSQLGNNNAYCQDNAITWLDWNAVDDALFQYTRQLISLRKQLAALTAHHWWQSTLSGTGTVAQWFNPNGSAIASSEWHHSNARAFMLTVEQGSLCMLLFNGNDHSTEFTLPAGTWVRRLDTFTGNFEPETCGGKATLKPSSLCVFETINLLDVHISQS